MLYGSTVYWYGEHTNLLIWGVLFFNARVGFKNQQPVVAATWTSARLTLPASLPGDATCIHRKKIRNKKIQQLCMNMSSPHPCLEAKGERSHLRVRKNNVWYLPIYTLDWTMHIHTYECSFSSNVTGLTCTASSCTSGRRHRPSARAASFSAGPWLPLHGALWSAQRKTQEAYEWAVVECTAWGTRYDTGGFGRDQVFWGLRYTWYNAV